MLALFIRAACTVLLGALLSGALVRLAPGFDVDERQMDARLSEQSLAALRAEREAEGDLLAFYGRFLSGYFTGDLGESRVLHQPVKALIAERVGPTAAAVCAGLAMAWGAALLFAVGAYFFRAVGGVALSVASATLLSIPVAVLAFAFVLNGSGSVRAASLVVGCAVFPKLAQYLDRLFGKAASEPHVLTAHARGLGPVAVFVRHVAGPCMPEVAALTGVSLAFALSAAIPAEVILDIAGIGQLAWQAALGRDLNLLVQLTMLITTVMVFANTLAECLSVRRRTAA